MKKKEREIKVVVNGEINLEEMPKEIFNIFVAMLNEEIEKQMNADNKSI